MPYTKSILFDFVSTSPNYGKIVASITDTVPISGGRNVYYEISGPLTSITGTFLYEPDFLNPDGFVDLTNPTATMPIVDVPIDSNGEFQEGQYTIKFYLREVSNPSAPQEIEASTFTLDILKQGPVDCELRGNIDVVLNCHCYTMTVTDRTNYRNSTIVSRQITIRPPAIPSTAPAPAPITTTFSTISIPFTHSNVDYGIGLYVVYENSFDNGSIIVREDIDANITEHVECDFNLCAILSCIDKEYAKLIAKMKGLGGWALLPIPDQDWWLLVENYMELLQNYLLCENWAKVDEMYAKIKALTGCDCGCGGGNANSPVPVSPSCGGSGAVTNIVGSYPINVNQSGTTAIVSLDAAYTTGIANAITNLQNTIAGINTAITNLQNSRLTNITTATPTFLQITAAGTVRNINFLPSALQYGGWIKLTNTPNANNTFGPVDFDTTPRPLQYRQNGFLEKIDMQGTFKYNGSMVSTGVCISNYVAISTTAPAGFMPIACTDAQGEFVGTLRLIPNPSGTQCTILFTATPNYVQNSVVYVNGSFNQTAI